MKIIALLYLCYRPVVLFDYPQTPIHVTPNRVDGVVILHMCSSDARRPLLLKEGDKTLFRETEFSGHWEFHYFQRDSQTFSVGPDDTIISIICI